MITVGATTKASTQRNSGATSSQVRRPGSRWRTAVRPAAAAASTVCIAGAYGLWPMAYGVWPRRGILGPYARWHTPKASPLFLHIRDQLVHRHRLVADV